MENALQCTTNSTVIIIIISRIQQQQQQRGEQEHQLRDIWWLGVRASDS